MSNPFAPTQDWIPPEAYGPHTGRETPDGLPSGERPIRELPGEPSPAPVLGLPKPLGVPWSEPPAPPSLAPAPHELRHRLDFGEPHHVVFTIPANTAAGVDLALAPGAPAGPLSLGSGFWAWRLLADNPTPYTLWLPDVARYVPPGVYGWPIYCRPALGALRVQTAPFSASSGANSAQIVIMALDSQADVGMPVALPLAANSFANGNNGAALGVEAIQLNEGGVFAWLRGAAQGANGSALDGAASTQAVPNTPAVASSAANASVTLTIAAVAGQRNTLGMLSFTCTPVSSAAAQASLTAAGVTQLFNFPSGGLGSASVPVYGVPFDDGGIGGAVGAAITVTLPALGAGVVGTINAGFTVG